MANAAPRTTLEQKLFGLSDPLWLRELQQTVRAPRTPLLLAMVVTLLALLLSGVGALARSNEDSAEVGRALHHTFFSLAFFVVSWTGAAVAASSIASERAGRTWEALALTRLGPQRIARGKFLAAFSYVVLYIVALSPISVMSFLFGGVTLTEVAGSLLLLGVFGALSVGLGLTLGTRSKSPAGAVVITLLLTVSLSLFFFLLVGVGGAYVAADRWSSIAKGAPCWLPTAWSSVPLTAHSLVVLYWAPLVATLAGLWFFREATIANLRDANEDRLKGHRYWLVTVLPLSALTAVSALALSGATQKPTPLAVATLAFFALLTLGCLSIQGEPLWNSRRIAEQWKREQRKPWLRPGIVPSSAQLGVVGALGLVVLGLGGYVLLPRTVTVEPLFDHPARLAAEALALLLSLPLYLGLAAYLRARSRSRLAAGITFFAYLFGLLLMPPFLMGMAWMVDAPPAMRSLPFMASPMAPFFYAVDSLDSALSPQLQLTELLLVTSIFGLLGFGLQLLTLLSVRRSHAAHQALTAALEQRSQTAPLAPQE